MKNEKTAILLVDAHVLVLQGIKRVLEQIPGMSVCAAVTTLKEAGRLLQAGSFDLYIIDIVFPDGNGFDLIDMIRKKDANARIIVNTMHEEIWVMNRLIDCHVNAIILNSSDVKDMEKALLSALNGETYYCPHFDVLRRKLRSRLCLELLKEDIPTTRELEVLHAVAQGWNTTQIANQLSITENTVETFRKRLIQKFNAKNSIDLVMKAINQGWIIPSERE